MADPTKRWSWFTNPFTTLNWTRKPGTYVYNENAMKQLSPHVREELLKGYYHGLGITESDVFHSALETYFTKQDEAFDKILNDEKYKDALTAEDRKELKEQLKTMQDPVRKSALAFDDTIPGRAPTSVHPSQIQDQAHGEKAKLLEDLGNFNLEGLLEDLKSRIDSKETSEPPETTSTSTPPKVKTSKHPQAIRNFLTLPKPTDAAGELRFVNILRNLHNIIIIEEELSAETDPIQIEQKKNRIEEEKNKTLNLLEQTFSPYKGPLKTELRAKNKSMPEPELDKLVNQQMKLAVEEKFNLQKEKIKTRLNELPKDHTRKNWIAKLVEIAQLEIAEEEKAKKNEPSTWSRLGSAAKKMGSGLAPGFDDEDEDEFFDAEEGSPEDKKKPEDKPSHPEIDVEALKQDLLDAQAEAKKQLEEDFNKTITAFDKAAQRERELIGWLAAAECARRLSATSSDPGYTVVMTAEEQERVKKLHEAIQKKDATTLSKLGLYGPSGLPILPSQDADGQLTFSITFPSAWWGRGYYSDPKHNSKADLLFQAALVRGTGAETIVTNIAHSNDAIARQLAREAFEAAREVGYKYSDKAEDNEITIQINGTTISRKDLFTEKLEDIQHPGQQIPEVDLSGTAEVHAGNAAKQKKAAEPPLNTPEGQRRLSEILNKGREAQDLLARETPKGGPVATF